MGKYTEWINLFVYLFACFALEQAQINSNFAHEREICICAAQQRSCRLQNIPFLVCRLTQPYSTQSTLITVPSVSSLICRNANAFWIQWGVSMVLTLLPTYDILLAATSVIGGANVLSVICLLSDDLCHCNKRSPSEAGAEFVPSRGVVHRM